MALNDDPNKKLDPAYEAGASVRNAVSGKTAWDSMGKSYMAQGAAVSQVADPIRKFVRGFVGAEPDSVAPPIVRPQIKFAGTDPAPETMFKRPASAALAPRTAAQLDAASVAEVAARNKASPASSSPGVGATAAAGGGSASSYFIGSNGVRRGINGDGTIAGSNPNAVTVNRQAFGSSAPSLRQPVASTFGLPVNDPRLNEQFMPARSTAMTLRSTDAMADQYNAREDRDARAKLASDLDSQRFRLEMIAANPGRRGRAALEALAQNAQQQQALASNAERLSAEANQNRANLINRLDNTALEQQGQNRRAEQDIMLRRDALAAEQSGVSQVLNDENGAVALLRRDGTVQSVQNQDGTPFRTAVNDRNKLTAADRLEFLRERMSGLEKAMADIRALNPTADVSGFQAQLDSLNKQAQDLLAGPKQPTSAQIALLKANPDKAADFDALFGQGAAARILGSK